MKLFFGQRASHVFAWASVVALLVGGPASSYRDIEAAHIEAEPAHSDVARSIIYVKDAFVDPDLRSVFPDDATGLADKVTFADPYVKASPLAPSDECLQAEACIDQYLCLPASAQGR